MLLWLRTPKSAEVTLAGVGVMGNVIRREEEARLLSLDDGFAALDEARRVLAEEQVEIQRQIEAEAQQRYEQAQQEGVEQGRQIILEEWYERTLGTLADYRAVQKRMRERLAELIASVVEQIVHAEDSKGLFLRALASLDQIAEGASFLTVSVNPKDLAIAQQVFDGFADEWSRRGQPIKVVMRADKELALGSCICESDFGIVDASLHTQIQAMRAALERALNKEMHAEVREETDEAASAAMHQMEPPAFDAVDALEEEWQTQAEAGAGGDVRENEGAQAEKALFETNQEDLLNAAATLPAAHDFDELAAMVSDLVLKETEEIGEIESATDLAALAKPKRVRKAKKTKEEKEIKETKTEKAAEETKPKSKSAAKTTAKAVTKKTAAKSKPKAEEKIEAEANTAAESNLEVETKNEPNVKPKAKRKPKASISSSTEEVRGDA